MRINVSPDGRRLTTDSRDEINRHPQLFSYPPAMIIKGNDSGELQSSTNIYAGDSLTFQRAYRSKIGCTCVARGL
ncbi:hypothetical protein DPMN_063753 [Dreissena polymorpha]|uniref:Uncharacterized protein n=1 Tax=Dreissena polymorpha TaxID=45954 RepID=A0A9D4HKG3_DREPO|nr:hypothetical protein DPMN_063753 [Dreissena polymorpha]